MQALATVRRDYTDTQRMWLDTKRSVTTRKGYSEDVRRFFAKMAPAMEFPAVVSEFLSFTRNEAVVIFLQYRADLQQEGLAPSTINRRLAAVKSLVKFANSIGHCAWTLDDIKGEKVEGYRDVSGPSVAQIAAMLQVPNQDTPKGKRDYALIRLLFENALRRNEVVGCNVSDFDPDGRTLAIIGKGRVQRETVTLSEKVSRAITSWLETRGELSGDAPLFTSVSNNQRGHRMTGTALYKLICEVGQAAGIPKTVSPHRMRHSAITTALEHLNGDVCKVQQLSRHKDISTVMIYADKLKNEQGDVTNLLSALA